MRTNSSFVLREIYGKAILMPVKYNEASNDPVYFNETAAQIWKFTSDAENQEELLKQMCEFYSLEENSVEKSSLKYFISYMIDQKLIFE